MQTELRLLKNPLREELFFRCYGDEHGLCDRLGKREKKLHNCLQGEVQVFTHLHANAECTIYIYIHKVICSSKYAKRKDLLFFIFKRGVLLT